MAVDIFYKQCILKKTNQTQVAWLPEMFCQVGNFVELEINKKWEDGWKIINVGKARMSGQQVNEQSQEYKHQRKASDI